MAGDEIDRPNREAPFKELSKIALTIVSVAVFLAILMGAMDNLVVATVLPTIAQDRTKSMGSLSWPAPI